MTLRLPYVTPAKNPQSWATPDATVPTNLQLFQNPIPVNNSELLIPVEPVSLVKGRDYLQNMGMYTNPIPVYPVDYSTSRTIPDWLPPPVYPNLVLLSPVVVAVPFYTQDFSSNRTLPDWLPGPIYSNIAILNPVAAAPFFTEDFSTSRLLPDWLPPPTYPNLVLLTSTVATPFLPQDFSLNRILPDWLPAPVYPNLVLQNFSTPFVNTDWSKPSLYRTLVNPAFPNVVILQPVGNPFSQADWSKAYTIKPIASDQNTLPNLLLIQPSIPSTPLGIFSWKDWSYTKSPVVIVPDEVNLPNIALPNTPPEIVILVGGKSRWLEDYKKVIQPDVSAEIKKAAAVISKLGGHARAKALTSTQRSNIASTAAKARWR